MPELPEVETVCRGLNKSILGKVIANAENMRPNLRIAFPDDFSSALEERKIVKIHRRAKYILITLDDDRIIIMHLGMSGKIIYHNTPKEDLAKHDHAVIEFSDNSQIIFNDPRRFGLITFSNISNISSHKLIHNLGVEPLTDEFDGAYLFGKLQKKSTPIKKTIMDANLVVGVGNIYACEALFKSKIMPDRKSNQVNLQECNELAGNIKQVLIAAINSGGSTLRDYVNSSGDSGYFQHQFDVYGRENEECRFCGNKILRMKQSGRSTFYCANCQD